MTARIARNTMNAFSFFHTTARGNNKQVLFHDAEDKVKYLQILNINIKKFDLKCFAYCLMDNHVHFLFQTPHMKNLSKAYHGAHTSYVHFYRKKYPHTGHLFEDRFDSRAIETHDRFIATISYIENNPVKAGLVLEASEYLWSSVQGDCPHITLTRPTVY